MKVQQFSHVTSTAFSNPMEQPCLWEWDTDLEPEAEELPEQDAVAVDVRLGGELAVHDALGGHPAHRQQRPRLQPDASRTSGDLRKEARSERQIYDLGAIDVRNMRHAQYNKYFQI